MDIKLRHLEILHTIVVSGSISNARRILGLSQPTISQQLAKLEKTLDAQLIYRIRGQEVVLTQAGEHWFKVAQNVLNILDQASVGHKSSMATHSLDLRVGATPSLRGRFIEKVATLSRRIPEFSKMEFFWAFSSNELAEMIAAHKINCAILSASSIEAQKESLHVSELFRDKIVLAVPSFVDEQELARVLSQKDTNTSESNPLRSYVEIDGAVPWKAQSEHWYRSRMPRAVPHFSCMTHQSAVDIVAAGLATCHAPLSLLPNLPQSITERIKVYDLGEYARDAVLVMPRHLMSLRPYVDFQRQLTEWVKKEYSDENIGDELLPLPELTAVDA